MTDPTPDISVVVPTRNREALVRRLLGQLVRLDDGLVYEIIVVDEGSSDGTPALLRRLEESHGIRVLRHDVPVGLPAARNAGIGVARAPFIAWIDDDDLTAPDRLRRQHEALRETGRRWSCSARVEIDDDLRIVGHFPCPPEEDLLPRLVRFNCIPTAAQGLLVARDLMDEVGGFDTALRSAEDWDFCIRLTVLAPPHLLNEPLVGYRIAEVSMSTDTSTMEEAIAAVLDKHAALRRELGVEADWAAIHRSLLATDLLVSRRRGARRALKALQASPTLRNAARGAVAVAAPRWRARDSAARRVAQVPESWHVIARRWLDDVPAAAAALDA